MKIAMVFDGLQYGGIERVGIDYARMLISMGHSVTIYNLNPSFNQMENEFDKSVCIVHLWFPKRMAPENYSNLIKKGIGYKLLYPLLYIGITCVDVLYKWFLKILNKLSGDYDMAIAFSGHYNDLTFVSKNFVRCSKKICWLHGALYGYAILSNGFLNLYKEIKNLVVLNDVLQDEVLIANRQLAGLNIKKIYNPSFIASKPIDVFKVKQLKEKYGLFFVMVGRLDVQKDQLSVIRALEHIHKKYNFSEKLILVGDGSMRKTLEDYVRDHNLQEWVVFEGNKSDVQNYYAAAYLFVHASPLEGLPTTLIEALHFGVPIIATDSFPGVREVLKDNEYGIVTRVGDYEKMGEEIYKMYTNPAYYDAYNGLGKERFLEFSPERIQKEIEKILKW